MDTTNDDVKYTAEVVNEAAAVPHTVLPDAMPASPAPRSTFRTTAILIALYLSMFICAMDQLIVSTAIPTIVGDLNGKSGFVWIGGAYLLANAAASPIWVKLSDIWGRKAVLLCVVMWFAAASVVCATAKSMNDLIIGRAFQGTAGAGLSQMVFVTMSDIFSMRRRTLFLGLSEIVWAVAGAVGPVLGGAFSEHLTWRWCFWINLPISAISFLMLFFFLDVHNPRTRALDGLKAIDWPGSISILGVTLMLLLGLNLGGEVFPWSSATVICLIVFGALMSVLFIISEKKLAQYPLIPPVIFSKRSNVAALLVAFFHGVTYIGGEYYLPLYLQAVKEASPLRSAVLILPFIVPGAVAAVITGIYINATGRYLEVIWTGCIALTIGNGLFCLLDAQSSLGLIIGVQVLAGIGAGLLFQPPLIALQAMVEQRDVATATGTLGFCRNIATSLSVVLGGVIFQNGMDSRAKELLADGLPAELVAKFSGSDAAANVYSIGPISDSSWKLAVKDAYASSLLYVWVLFSATAGCALIFCVFIASTKLSKEHVETKTGLQAKSEAAGHPQDIELRSS